MAARKTSSNAYDAEKIYAVVLNDRVEWVKPLVPGRVYEIKGDVLSGAAFSGKIETAEPIEAAE